MGRVLPFLLIVLFSCGKIPTLTFLGELDTTLLTPDLRDRRTIRLGVWLTPPTANSRPVAVEDFLSVEVKEGGRGGEVLGKYAWKTFLELRPGSVVYVGAFLEPFGFEDGIPQEGEGLIYHPVGYEGGTTVQVPTIVLGKASEGGETLRERVDRLFQLLNDPGGLFRFIELVHPFFFEPLEKDREDLLGWLSGTPPVSSYTDPLSAPYYGIFSPVVRGPGELGEINYDGERSRLDEGNRVGTFRVSYSYKPSGIKRTFEEEWKWWFDKDLRLLRWEVVSQMERGGFELKSSGITEPEEGKLLLVLQIVPPQTTPLDLFVEEYSGGGTFATIFSQPSGIGIGTNQISLGTNVPSGTGYSVPFRSDRYYRIIVVRPSDRVKAELYLSAPRYPYRK
jgi:hypothetical protein